MCEGNENLLVKSKIFMQKKMKYEEKMKNKKIISIMWNDDKNEIITW